MAVSEAREVLGLDLRKIALIFGVVAPYKGLEEVIDWWRLTQPDVQLAIVGKPSSPEYASGLAVKSEWIKQYSRISSGFPMKRCAFGWEQPTSLY